MNITPLDSSYTIYKKSLFAVHDGALARYRDQWNTAGIFMRFIYSLHIGEDVRERSRAANDILAEREYSAALN